jgi:hypothetical protein
MTKRISCGAATVLLVLAVGFASLATAASDRELTEKQANEYLKASDKALQKVEKAQQKGRLEEVKRSAEEYVRNLGRINEALARGTVRESEALDVASRVDEATLKHIAVLERVLGKVPEQARPALERALQQSRTGNKVATEAILRRGKVEWHGLLNDRIARQAMDRNEALVRLAVRARQRGDAETELRSIEQYADNTRRIAEAVERNAVDPSDAPAVFDRVSSSTSRHLNVLEGLLGQVPPEARSAIERAIANSQRGHRAATQAIARTPAAGVSAGRPGAAGPPAGVPAGGPGAAAGGRPGNAGKPPNAGRPPR